MKRASLILPVLFLVFAFGTGWAAENSSATRSSELADLYSAHIDRKMEVAKRVAEDQLLRQDARETCVSDVARDRADFYANNKDDLVREMLSREEIGAKPWEVDYFLITTFNDAHSQAVKTCRLRRYGTEEEAGAG